MGNIKFKVGDRVRIKSIDWYNENKDEYGYVRCIDFLFTPEHSKYCGCEFTISHITEFQIPSYVMESNGHEWTDEMIEGLVEEETKPEFKVGDKITNGKVILTILTLSSDRYVVEDTFGECGSVCFKSQDDWKLVEEENEKKLSDESWRYKNIFDPSQYPQSFELPEGYIFKDQAGNEIHALKIVLEKANTLKTQSDNTLKIQSDNMETETHRGYYTTEEETTNKSKKVAWFTFWDNDFADKVELDLSNRELIQEDGKWFVVKKKKEYPKTYKDSCKVLNLPVRDLDILDNMLDTTDIIYSKNLDRLLNSFRKLFICRDAYWKIAGEEMGLGEPWKPDYDSLKIKYTIVVVENKVVKLHILSQNHILSFPTEEMRDAFYENFKTEIEICKELL